MTQICGACQTINRDAAKYCRGCAAKLSTPPTHPSSVVSAASGARQGIVPARGVDASIVWLSLLLLLSCTVFVLWYAGRSHAQRPPPRPALALLEPPAATAGQTAALSLPPAPAKAVGSSEPSLPPSRASVIPQAANAGTGTAHARAATPDASAEAVAKFYRALSAGDGEAAAAFVTPAKRGVGPFNVSKMSSFYGSFREPLVLRGIRRIDDNVVEARYSYRMTRTRCEGTAIVETESVSQRRLIRGIRANC